MPNQLLLVPEPAPKIARQVWHHTEVVVVNRFPNLSSEKDVIVSRRDNLLSDLPERLRTFYPDAEFERPVEGTLALGNLVGDLSSSRFTGR